MGIIGRWQQKYEWQNLAKHINGKKQLYFEMGQGQDYMVNDKTMKCCIIFSVTKNPNQSKAKHQNLI